MTNLAALVPLAADFPASDEADWIAAAQKALAGAPWERLVGETADKIPLKPLYRAPDLGPAVGLPGQSPFARGRLAVRDPYLPWDIRQALRAPDPATANRNALEDLARGASSIELVAPTDLARTLDGVLPELATVALSAPDLALAARLRDWLLTKGDPAAMRPAFNLDAVTPWLRAGAAEARFEDAMSAHAVFAADTLTRFPAATVLRACGRGAHEAGGTEAQELALMLASGVAGLRALEAAGLALEQGAKAILFRLSVGPDVMVEIAKLRAARLLWAKVMEAAGAAPGARAMQLQAVTSRRMMTRYDSWTNILRATAACFAAGCGGADVITVLPLTALLGEAGPQARRIARNTQIILQEESHLGRVADPAGGSFAVEALTQALAAKAWTIFQAIEAGGGVGETLRAGWLQAEIAKAAAERAVAIAKRRLTLTGLSDFPLLDETPPAFTPFSSEPTPQPTADPIAAAPWITLAAPFEALRDKAAAAKPTAFLATLGPLAEFSARANFAQNLLAAGGVRALGADAVHADVDAMAAAFVASGARVAVLCGSDARYQEEAPASARALKAAGATWVALAGKPGEAEAIQRAAGVDQYLFAGQDTLVTIETLHAALGVG